MKLTTKELLTLISMNTSLGALQKGNKMEYKEFIRHYTNILNAGTVTSKGVEKYVRKEVQLIAYGNGVSFQKALDDLIDIYFDQSMRNTPGYLQDQSTTAATNLFFIKFMDTHSKEDKHD